MSLFARWTWGRAAVAIRDLLGDGVTVGVAARPALARVLADKGVPIVELPEGPPRGPIGKASEKTPAVATGAETPRVDATEANAKGAGREPDAVVVAGVGERDDADETLAAWVHALPAGTRLVMVDRVEPHTMTRRALCAGLVDLEQRPCGRLIVTAGRVPVGSVLSNSVTRGGT